MAAGWCWSAARVRRNGCAAELDRLGYGAADVARDLAGIERVVSARWG